MAHIHLEDGAFSPFWVIVWWAVALAIIGIALFLIRNQRKPDNRRITLAAFCVAAAFVISQVEVPIAAGVHLSLTPLIAILTGPVIGLLVVFIANILSAAIGHGGWGMIGANTLVSLSEILVAYAIWRGLKPFIENVFARAVAATLSGLIIGNCVMMGIIGLSGIQGSGLSMEQVITSLFLIASINVAVAVIEAFLAGLVVLYIGKMRPDLVDR
ncbi:MULTISPECIES: energy-coupling factor ABC transporter permease [unclassified Methanoregula]|uniref:energy-coupling factor ABC transporter permease n=1 Tax=unclassified Methanoregula TaxID=2649730 RepID=UPI0009CDF4B1|nr:MULTISPECIES: energy-coupling factor ABC transporter permease [unclassified Methanoregula]OPX64406.1 MAG: cobalt transport protein CbiM [Methanoregula sp. PtaB.Bin085]OPY34924.1 MAG: cobalt transport protein CbiM [Methanoregula sp. PtaU1.Bin006]